MGVKNERDVLQVSTKREVASGKQQIETWKRALGFLVPGEISSFCFFFFNFLQF
jgi:hypothetical protein